MNVSSAASSAAALASSAQQITLTAAQAQQVQQLGKVDAALAETTAALSSGRNGAGQLVNILT